MGSRPGTFHGAMERRKKRQARRHRSYAGGGAQALRPGFGIGYECSAQADNRKAASCLTVVALRATPLLRPANARESHRRRSATDRHRHVADGADRERRTHSADSAITFALVS